MGLRILDNAKPIYQVPHDDLVREVMIEGFKASTAARCMVGYFDSLAFRAIAPGLAEFINNSTGTFSLLASPVLSPEDQDAIRLAVDDPESVVSEYIQRTFASARVSEDDLIRHNYDCFAFLLAKGRLGMRLVLMKNGAMFHPKVWLFDDGIDTVALHGSSNATTPGLLYNFETVRLERPWRSVDAEETVSALAGLFERLWNRKDDDAIVMELPAAVRLDLMRDGQTRLAPTIQEFWAAWYNAYQVARPQHEDLPAAGGTPERLVIPPHLEWESGAFAHQGAAVNAWEMARFRGVLAMATGAGKTITAMICAARRQEPKVPFLVVVAAPYRPLIEQWEDEVRAFGVKPLRLLELSGDARTSQLQQAINELRLGHTAVHVVVITHDYLVDPRFRSALDAIPSSVKSMLIADEVHNLGAPSFVADPPERFDFRLGLSATPERQYDALGTTQLFQYFGGDGPIFEFTLSQAIAAGCLVPYTYHLHPVEMSDDEFAECEDLTAELYRAGYASVDEDSTQSDKIRRLLIKRRAVIENTASKLDALRDLLSTSDLHAIRHVLIYASDKNPAQLTSVNRLLKDDLGVLFHQLTSAETANRQKTQSILSRFTTGQIQIVTCKRVLDEGVNIPQVAKAYLLASSAVKRQWVQRRGRILRRCDAINKLSAELHDFLAIPPDPSTPAGRSILGSERARALEFAAAAANAGGADDPFEVIDRFAGNHRHG